MAAAAAEVKNDAENFQQVNFQNKKTIKVNSLFNLVQALIQTNHELCSKYKIDSIQTEDRAAFIFKFKDKPYQPLFNNFEFVESHLTIDKWYAEVSSERGAQGFTAAHYTERYKQNASNQEIIVHVFFNAQGQYVYSQIRQMPEAEVFRSINVLEENTFKNNSMIAASLLKDLLHVKSNFQTDYTEKATALETTLSELSVDLNLPKNRTNYIKTARKFIKSVETLNLYNEITIDRRGLVIQKMMDKLLALKEDIRKKPEASLEKPAPLNEALAPIPLANNAERSSPAVVPKPISAAEALHKANLHEKESITKALLELEAEFTLCIKTIEKEVPALLRAFELAQKLQEMLCDLMICDIEKFDKKLKKRIEGKINKLPKVEDLMKKFFASGNVQGFKRLFPLLSNHANLGLMDIYHAIIKRGNTPAEEELTEAQISIFNFLYEHSDFYRSACKELGKVVEYNMELSMGMTILFKTCVANKFNVFSMMLAHGADPNQVSLLHEATSIPLIRGLLYVIKDIRYLELLLKYGTSVDCPANIGTHIVHNKKEYDTKTFFDQHHAIAATPKDKDVLQRLNQTRFELLLAFQFGQFEYLPLLAPRSSLASIASALSMLVNMPYFSTRHLIPTLHQKGLHFCTQAKRDEITIAETSTKNYPPHLQWLEIITMPNESSEHYQALTSIMPVFKERCRRNANIIASTIQQLMAMAKGTADKQTVYYYYAACLFLLCERGTLDYENTQLAMQINCKMGALFYKDLDPMKQKFQGFNRFVIAVDFAAVSPYREALNKLPIFDFAVKKLVGTEFEIDLKNLRTVKHSPTAAPVLLQYASASASSLGSSLAATDPAVASELTPGRFPPF